MSQYRNIGILGGCIVIYCAPVNICLGASPQGVVYHCSGTADTGTSAGCQPSCYRHIVQLLLAVCCDNQALFLAFGTVQRTSSIFSCFALGDAIGIGLLVCSVAGIYYTAANLSYSIAAKVIYHNSSTYAHTCTGAYRCSQGTAIVAEGIVVGSTYYYIAITGNACIFNEGFSVVAHLVDSYIGTGTNCATAADSNGCSCTNS